MTDEKEVYVGAVIEINQKRINLIPSTPINKIDERGLKLSLEKPLPLGTFGDAMDSICKDIGIDNPLAEKKIEEINSPFLQKAAKKAENANMRIEALQYEQPPIKYKVNQDTNQREKADQQDPTKYLFVASVNWPDDPKETDDASKDFFKLKGLIFGISSGFTDDESGDNPEVRKAFQSALQAMTPVAALASATDKSAESSETLAKAPQSLTTESNPS